MRVDAVQALLASETAGARGPAGGRIAKGTRGGGPETIKAVRLGLVLENKKMRA